MVKVVLLNIIWQWHATLPCKVKLTQNLENRLSTIFIVNLCNVTIGHFESLFQVLIDPNSAILCRHQSLICFSVSFSKAKVWTLLVLLKSVLKYSKTFKEEI